MVLWKIGGVIALSKAMELMRRMRKQEVEADEIENFLMSNISEMSIQDIQFMIAELEKTGFIMHIPLTISAELYRRVAIAKKKRGDKPSYLRHYIRSATNVEELETILSELGPDDHKELVRAIRLEKETQLLRAIEQYKNAGFMPGVVWVTQKLQELPEKALTILEMEIACEYTKSINQFYRAVNCAARLVDHYMSIGEYDDASYYLNLMIEQVPSMQTTIEYMDRYANLKQLAQAQELIRAGKYLDANYILTELELHGRTEHCERLRRSVIGKSVYFASDFFKRLSLEQGYSTRPKQVQMANEIENCIRNNLPLMIEAEVGIGKSFAYLVPMLLWKASTKLNKTLVVSTSSIVLQNQLIDKDIPQINNLLQRYFKLNPVQALIGKGRSNFACSNRIRKLMEENRKKFGSKNDLNKKLQEFMERSYYLDKDECPEELLGEWMKISADKCRCNYDEDCSYVKYREHLASHDGIIVCNHQQLLAHLKNEPGSRDILPPIASIAAIVIDEAHKLEDAAKTIFTSTIKINELENHLTRLSIAFDKYYQGRNSGVNPYENELDQAFRILQLLEDNIESWIVPPTFDTSQNQDELSIDEIEEGRFKLVREKADAHLSSLYNALINLKKGIDTIHRFGSQNELPLIRTHEKILEILFAFLNDQSYVTWVEKNGSENTYVFSSMKKEYSDFLSHNLLHRGIPVILVSGTLTIGNSFDYMREKFGYNSSFPSPIVLRNDFDYGKNRIAYIPKGLPSPRQRDNKYYDELSQEILRLICLTKGRSLVLFTNYKDLEEIHGRVTARDLGFQVFKHQKNQSNPSQLLTLFRQDVSSCLFGTGSFYEGIDIRGQSLQHVIIVKLPYPVLDPVLEYEITEAGNEKMSKILLPRMMIQCRQAIGRLIRSEQDIGIVSILDTRLNIPTSQARQLVMDELAPSYLCSSFAELTDIWRGLENIHDFTV
jgi:ATP-dependent DNA helicase DinG